MADELKVLDLSMNIFLKHVPHLSNFVCLERLDLNACTLLESLVGLEQLVSLTYLNLSYCEFIKKLPDLSKLCKLRTLIMRDVRCVKKIRGLEKLELLEVLDVRCCFRLQRLPDLSNFHKLTIFDASYCRQLVKVQGLNGLPLLECLYMIRCSAMKRYPDVCKNKKLKTLVKCFSEVREVEGLGELEALEHLVIHSTQCLHSLPQLSKLTKLTRLKIDYCNDLVEISLQGLESLEDFRMYHCSTVRSVTFARLKMLQCIRITECGQLTEIRGLSGFNKKLWCIIASKCGKLTEFQGVEQLTSLTMLTIIECNSLVKENLPGFINLGEGPSLLNTTTWSKELACVIVELMVVFAKKNMPGALSYMDKSEYCDIFLEETRSQDCMPIS